MEHVKAFIDAQGDLGAALKTAKNPFLKNDYAPLDQVQDAVIPVFGKHGFAVIQLGGSDECGQYIDTRLDHESGSGYCCRIYLQFKAGDMQSLGSAITYARRYGLLSITGVATKDDDGQQASGIQSQKVARCDQLISALGNPTAEMILQFEREVKDLHKQVHGFDQSKAEQLRQAYKSAEKKVTA